MRELRLQREYWIYSKEIFTEGNCWMYSWQTVIQPARGCMWLKTIIWASWLMNAGS